MRPSQIAALGDRLNVATLQVEPHVRIVSGAPRPMKMGTTASPWRYDAAAAETIRPDNQRRTTILRYASWAAVFPISLVVRLPFDSGPFDQSRDRRDGTLAAALTCPQRSKRASHACRSYTAF